tara:strand:+ start:364 stop:666 length:303 start_codon:yes stop_codon:yes gene_type:complete
MEHQKSNHHRSRTFKPRKERTQGFHGYFVEVREGEDPMRAYRKIKKKQKDDKFFEELKDRQYFRKPSFIKREKEKRRKQLIRRATKDSEDSRLMRTQRSR